MNPLNIDFTGDTEFPMLDENDIDIDMRVEYTDDRFRLVPLSPFILPAAVVSAIPAPIPTFAPPSIVTAATQSNSSTSNKPRKPCKRGKFYDSSKRGPRGPYKKKAKFDVVTTMEDHQQQQQLHPQTHSTTNVPDVYSLLTSATYTLTAPSEDPTPPTTQAVVIKRDDDNKSANVILINDTPVCYFNAWIVVTKTKDLDIRNDDHRTQLQTLFDRIETGERVRSGFKDITVFPLRDITEWGTRVILEAVFIVDGIPYTRLFTLFDAWAIGARQVEELFARNYSGKKTKQLQSIFDKLNE